MGANCIPKLTSYAKTTETPHKIVFFRPGGGITLTWSPLLAESSHSAAPRMGLMSDLSERLLPTRSGLLDISNMPTRKPFERRQVRLLTVQAFITAIQRSTLEVKS